ncbi:serine/threonine-protein phosphatase [Acidobacteria bacterium AH-259-A15]|nr:serine/threonine-protein phosphatase [Acidobacteria bacterium AH-259-A15]
MRRSVIKDAIVLGSGTLLVLAIFLLGRFIHATVHGACNCTPGLLVEYGPSSLMLIGVAGTTLWVLMARSKARLFATKELKRANERMKSELEAAAKTQESLLPRAAPDVAGVSFAWAFKPCNELAGDIFNVFPLDEQHVGVYVLDVSGHGVTAALLSVTLHRVLLPEPSLPSVLKQYVGGSRYRILSPAEVAEQLNGQFPMDPAVPQYFTLLYGMLNLERHEFRYVSAGHPGPVYLPRAAEPAILEAQGLPIGFFKEASYQEHSITMKPGDRLYLYSDGITEAMNEKGEEFGKRQLIRALDHSRARTLKDSLSSLFESVDEWRGDARLEDDISVLAAEIAE